MYFQEWLRKLAIDLIYCERMTEYFWSYEGWYSRVKEDQSSNSRKVTFTALSRVFPVQENILYNR